MKHPRFILIAACLIASRLFADENFRVEKDISYLGDDDQHKADLYTPANIANGQLCPGIVIIHGGGWSSGDKAAKRELNIGGTLAQNSYVCISINYVLSSKRGGVTWPKNLQQCKTAVRWLRKNAERLHVDPDHIGAIGGSAGGQLVSMLGVTSPADGFDPKEPWGDVSCAVQAVVDMYGPIDLMKWHDISMFGKKRTEAPELYKQASPVTYLKKGQPPFLILHGTADTIVDIEQSKIFDAALEKAEIEHQFVIVEGAPHTFDLQPKQRDLRPLVLEFFDKHLKKKN